MLYTRTLLTKRVRQTLTLNCPYLNYLFISIKNILYSGICNFNRRFGETNKYNIYIYIY